VKYDVVGVNYDKKYYKIKESKTIIHTNDLGVAKLFIETAYNLKMCGFSTFLIYDRDVVLLVKKAED
jgi:hypothetical protein